MTTARDIVVIVGASEGIGRALGEALSDSYDIVGMARRTPETPPGFKYLAGVDALDLAALKAAAQQIDRTRLWGLIVTAGAASMNHFAAVPEATRRRTMDLNFHGAANAIEVFGKQLMRNKGGRILTFSTVAVPLLLEGEAAYVAAKAAVEAYTKVIAKELAEWNITANVIGPGPVDTALIGGLSPEMKQALTERMTTRRLTEREDVIATARFLLSREARQVTGQTITLSLATP
ncbi:MAG: SDR family NAD(P)-dependent oxidoreductase [Hyphomonadaceae bacterium]